MRRVKYGQNFTINNYAKFFQLIPISLMEVVPGDTLSGKVTARVISDSTNRVIQNRTYMDVYSFYVPYRLVFDEFPAFIAGDTTVSLPTPPAQGRNQLLTRNDNGNGNYHTMQLSAYNLIWNQFFRTEDKAEVNIQTNRDVLPTPLRPTTIVQRLKAASELADQTVDTSGSTLTVGAIREAFAKDRYEKIRAFYGSKYTDYLASLGVETTWSILDEPELIGSSNATLPFQTVNSTAEGTTDNVGDASGRWQGSSNTTMKRTFASEHGVVITVATVRMDVESVWQIYPLFAQKTTYDQFFQPQMTTQRKREWQTFAGDATLEGYSAFTEMYDEYRHPQNISVDTIAGNGAYFVRPTTAQPGSNAAVPDWFRYIDPDDLDFFNGYYGEDVQYTITGVTRATKVSPVPQSESVRGVA
jgi:hypothetical protein